MPRNRGGKGEEMDEVTRLENEIEREIAEMRQLKREVPPGSDAEMRQFQLDSHIGGAEREISALEQYRRERR
ncbi:MAG: hypothetical protein ABSH44_00530 [Bryobacteraceae bacterium]